MPKPLFEDAKASGRRSDATDPEVAAERGCRKCLRGQVLMTMSLDGRKNIVALRCTSLQSHVVDKRH
jgi:hypothetical protein